VDHDDGDDGERAIAKPDELLALYGVTTDLFLVLKRWFGVPDSVSLDLSNIDAAIAEMGDPVMIAALAMRKLQALHLVATPGVKTTTDVVITVVQDLDRALVQAPNMRLKLAAATTDWDAALRELEAAGEDAHLGAPTAADEEDPETRRFRFLHSLLHNALRAVVEASGGEIRVLV
jgi:hypothetical protein